MDPKMLCAFLLQHLETFKKLLRGKAIFRIPRVVHNAVADFKHAPWVVTAAYGFWNMANGFFQKINMGKIIQIDNCSDIAGKLKLIGRCGIGGKHNVLPFEIHPENPNILRVAMADPLDILAVDDLSIVTNMIIEPMVATPSDIHFGIERYYGNEQVAKMADAFSEERKKQQEARGRHQEEENEEVDNAPIVVLVNKIIEQAVNERASDIHIEAMETSVRVRFRIDGVMQEMMR